MGHSATDEMKKKKKRLLVSQTAGLHYGQQETFSDEMQSAQFLCALQMHLLQLQQLCHLEEQKLADLLQQFTT